MINHHQPVTYSPTVAEWGEGDPEACWYGPTFSGWGCKLHFINHLFGVLFLQTVSLQVSLSSCRGTPTHPSLCVKSSASAEIRCSKCRAALSPTPYWPHWKSKSTTSAWFFQRRKLVAIMISNVLLYCPGKSMIFYPPPLSQTRDCGAVAIQHLWQGEKWLCHSQCNSDSPDTLWDTKTSVSKLYPILHLYLFCEFFWCTDLSFAGSKAIWKSVLLVWATHPSQSIRAFWRLSGPGSKTSINCCWNPQR